MSYAFALKVVNVYKCIASGSGERVMATQLLKKGHICVLLSLRLIAGGAVYSLPHTGHLLIVSPFLRSDLR